MALFNLRLSFSNFLTLVAFISFIQVNPSYCSNPRKLPNSSYAYASVWSPADATWYGSPHGAGSNGGACGYGNSVEQPPFNSMVSAGGSTLFNSGKGCGTCYEVKCMGNSACSGKSVTVVITDECPECGSAQRPHFDLSGTAFGAMAVSGQADKLRSVGRLEIQYRRVECKYPGSSMTFKVDSGSNLHYFAVVIEYEDGDGDLGNVELRKAQESWRGMQHSWGAVWKLNADSPLRGPLSIRLTSIESHKTVVANNVIPVGWKPGETYRSVVNYN